MAILEKGYSVTIILAVLTFGLVRSLSLFLLIFSSSFWTIEICSSSAFFVNLYLCAYFFPSALSHLFNMAVTIFAVHTLDAVH